MQNKICLFQKKILVVVFIISCMVTSTLPANAILTSNQTTASGLVNDLRLQTSNNTRMRDSMKSMIRTLIENLFRCNLQRGNNNKDDSLTPSLCSDELDNDNDIFTFGYYNVVDKEVIAEEFPEVPRVIMFGHVHFDPDGSGDIEPDLLMQSIENKIPDKNFSGYVCLDAEKNYSKRLKEAEVGSDIWEHNLDELEEAFDIILELRPNVKLSMWGFPFTGLWYPPGITYNVTVPEYLDPWIERWKAAQRTWERFDYWNPSIYDPYPDGEPWGDEKHRLIHYHAKVWTINLCKEMNPDIPILPAIWIRSTNWGDPEDSYLMLLPVYEVLRDQINMALEEGVDGFIYWEAPKWHWEHYAIPPDEVPPPSQATWNEVKGYFMEIDMRYISAIQETMKSAQDVNTNTTIADETEGNISGDENSPEVPSTNNADRTFDKSTRSYLEGNRQ